MIKFSRMVFLLTPFLVFVMGANVALGHEMSLPEEVVSLHLGDMCELPCWIGITPGQTTVAVAEKRLQQVYKNWQLVRKDSYTALYTVTTSDGMQLQIEAIRLRNPEVIDTIQFKLADPGSIALGDVMSALPPPKTVMAWAGSSQTDVFHDWYQLWFSHSPQDHAHRDVISAQNAFYGIKLVQNMGYLRDGHEFPLWHGFGVYDFKNVVLGEFSE
jgi:hypothetical protein